MIHTITAHNHLNSLKPIKEIRLRTFKQIYQKQTSKPDLFNHQEPRKSFLNVTRRYSTIGCTYSAAQEHPTHNKYSFLKQKPSSLLDDSAQKSTLFINFKKGKQNCTVNRIPIKIKSKRVNSKHLQLKKHKSFSDDTAYNFGSSKLLQSPFHDDFICIERQFAIEENELENEQNQNLHSPKPFFMHKEHVTIDQQLTSYIDAAKQLIVFL